MGLKKYGTGDGEVLPEEGDVPTPDSFTEQDTMELRQELRTEAPDRADD